MHENLKIRLATIDDIKNVFDLSNDDVVRKNSINPKKILWQNHVEWFKNRIKKENEPFYIAENQDGDFIGQIRFDKREIWEISVSIVEKYRGKGLASSIIKKASKKSKLKNIIAFIKLNNLASKKAFEKAGYKFQNEIIINNEKYFELHYINGVYIIAEMSANHCGDFELAKKIIKKAKEIGADAVKIQTYTADTITINSDNEEFIVKGGLWDKENLYSLYQKAYTPWEWQKDLKEYADSIGIDFFSTPFDKTAVDFLESINVPMYKIASFEAIDYPLIKYAASKMKPMIISVGISSEEEIQGAIDACKSVGNNDITILKCTSAYPAKLEDMNLLTIKDMIDKYQSQGVKIGLSDHSMSIIPPVVAVSLGATVIEKHFTLDRALGGADSGFSLNIEEFKKMIEAVRNTEKVLGKVDYAVNETNRNFARSLYVVKDIKKGEKFTSENIRSIRPSKGLHPKYYDKIIGKCAKRDLSCATPLSLDDIFQSI